jgi:transcriptional regulator with XRE-family HTH domain
MGIKQQIIEEFELRKRLKDDRVNLTQMAKDIGVSYSGLRKWMNDDTRGINDATLDKMAEYMGKRIVLISKDV